MLIEHLPPSSALHRHLYPDHAGWTTTDYLLAEVIDQLAAANWQRGNAGAKRLSDRPAPFYRPPVPGTRQRRSFEDRVRDWKRRHIDGR